jgi:hypothetical protein
MATLTVRTVTTLSALLVSRACGALDPDPDPDSDFDGLREVGAMIWRPRGSAALVPT